MTIFRLYEIIFSDIIHKVVKKWNIDCVKNASEKNYLPQKSYYNVGNFFFYKALDISKKYFFQEVCPEEKSDFML